MFMYNYREKKSENNAYSLLSATKPKEILQINLDNKQQLKTKLKQKRKLIVYIKDDGYYLEHSAAYALGLVNTRSIMLDKPKLVKINNGIHSKLQNDDTIEIEYVNLIKEEKNKIQVFVNNNDYYLMIGAAYALGLINDEEFYNSSDNYYYIDESFINILKDKYDVEFNSLNLIDDNINRYHK